MLAAAVIARTFESSARRVSNVLLAVLVVIIGSLSLSAQIAVSPTTLTFSSQLITTSSAAKSVTVTNNGASAQAVNFVLSGDYAESDNCGGSIAGSGGFCTVKITFSPTVLGSIKGAASIYDNSHNLLAFIGLTGTGGAPVTTSPASLSFTGGTIGTTSAAKTFKITNNTTSSVNITSITTNVSDYTITTGTCLTAALASKGKFCTVTVTVTPTSAADDGAIIITDNSTNTGALPLAEKLTSAATGGTASPISLTKSSLTFKTLSGTTSAAQTVTVKNISASTTITIGALTPSTDYSVLNNLCTAALAPSGTCTFQIEFSPTFIGIIEGSVAVPFTPSSGNSPQLVDISGTSEANLTVAPASLTFTSQSVGTTSTAKSVKITNNSASAVTLSSVVTSGDFQIQLTGTTCSLSGGTLGAAKTCTIEIQFAPTIAGSVLGALTVTNTSSPDPLLIGLSGTGVISSAAVLNPASAHQGSAETIAITGTDTNFGPTTTVNFGADITTGTVTVNGPTSASVPITIDNVAATGSRNVTITTGAQVVTGSFTVITGVPAVTLINPNTIQPTQTETVSITGAFTNWVNGTTKANFGPGIAVGGAAAGAFGPVTVNSATSLTASLVTSGASNGFRSPQIQTGAQTLTVNNGMFVETCNGTAPTVLQINPASNATNVPLNTHVQVQFSVPMNRSTFLLGNTSGTSIYFYDTTTTQEVPGSISLDASGTIATIVPSVTLYAGRQYYVYLSYEDYVQDACGDNLGSVQYGFVTAFGDNLTGPTLTGTSPESGDTNIPLSNASSISTPVVLQFSEQVDPVTAQNGFTMTTGGNPVLGNFSYSTNDETVTFTPVNPLTASTTYTVGYTTQITDTAGDPLTNPGSFSFSTGTSSATTGPSVTLVDPPNNTLSVGLNVTPHITFSEPVNELTIPAALALYYQGNFPIPATVTVAANRLTATVTPTAALLPNTQYELYICGYSDIAGNAGGCLGSYFNTGTSTDTTHATVTTINPANSQTGVPLNTLVSAVMSNQIDPTSITNSSITVTPSGGSAIAGTVALAADGVTLTFTPTAALTASKVYNVSVGGFNDLGGNAVTTFSSSFTTGTTGYGSGSFTVSLTSPTNGATGVSVTSPVSFTMTNLINAASVNNNTVVVYDPGAGEVVAGSYAISGNMVTFTPLTQYPASTQMYMGVNGLTDEAGNPDTQYWYTFTTTSTVDHTAPTVTISPANNATNVGLNAQIVLTFSKSINVSTVTANTLALFNGDTLVSYNYAISRDNRTITINAGGSSWTPGATIALELTNGIQDLSGNALANTNSQFTLTTALSGTTPGVLAMRPGNGATNVPANAPITLFTSAAMNTSTLAGALNVTDNGVVVAGTLLTTSNGQAIQFTPGNPFGAGDLIQVFLGSTAQSADGIALTSFFGQFTVAGSLTNTAAVAQAVNPFVNAASVPLNTVVQVEYNQALQSSTVTCTGGTGSVILYDNTLGSYLNPNCTVSGGVITIAPTSNLSASHQYEVYVDYGANVTNTDGVAVQAFQYFFTTGTTADTAAPTIVSEAPTNAATNIGTNTQVSVNFNKAMNPVSVTGSTIQLSGGGVTETPSSISFSPDFTRVSVVPQAPLPPSTQMTLKVIGVLSQAGKSVATTTTSFTTAAAPDFTPPAVVNSSVLSGQVNVPVNSVFTMTFSKPMDIGSYNAADVNIYGGPYPNGAPATVTWSADQTTIFIVPSSAMYVGTQYCLESFYMTDLDGNPETNFNICFTTSFVANTTAPTVVNTSPENGETAVPTNAPVEILFSEPIQPTSIGFITVATGGNPVAVTPTFSDGYQLLTLTPTVPLLAANANFTITITGVKDTAGNTMTGTTTNTFTTGATFDLAHASVVLSDPAPNTVGVGTNVIPRVQFSKRLNPLSVVTSSNESYDGIGSVELYNNATSQWVPITVSMDSTRTIATLTPASALSPFAQYELYIGCSINYYDVAGNSGSCYTSFFTTGSGSDTTHTTVSTISPANSQTVVPLNMLVSAVMSDSIDPTTITNSSITVTPSGGGAIAGTVALAADGVTLTFTPTATLTASTVYNVSVGGFNDVQSNPVTVFTSSFTTGTTGYGSGSFTVSLMSPANGATGVSVTSPVSFTMTNLINAASVNNNTVVVYDPGAGEVVAGSYAISGNIVTFTPLTQYPASTQMYMGVNGLTDEAGNPDTQYWYTFTTTSTVDHTAPTVTITPSNGSTNLGLNTQAVLTFSKSINAATIGSSTVNLLNGHVPLNPSITISRDNRTVVLTTSGLPAGATLTVTASHLITDLSGNALADTSSQFTTTTAPLNTAPSVISMRPGNGATTVPTNTVITLFTSAPMNAGTVPGALFVAQNGIPISGTTTVGSNGQSIEFTPSSALAAGTVTQVFLNSTAQDIYGNYLSYFAASFTSAGSPTNTAAVAQAVNPFVNAANVPLNTVVQVEYNQPLQSSTVTCTGSTGSVILYDNTLSSFLNPNCTVSGGVITIGPTSNLTASHQYEVYVDYNANVTNTDGVAVQAFQYFFNTGTAADTAKPTIVYLAPPNSALNIGTNAEVSATFNKPMNPVSVTGSTIQLSGGGVTETPSSISFTPDFTRATIVPQAPLPASTSMTIAINGVTSEAGVAVTSQSTSFTTMAGPNFAAPYVINSSVQSGETVGINADFAVQFNTAVDPGSANPLNSAGVNPQNVYVYDNDTGIYATTTLTFSADLTTVFLKPTANLTPSHSYQLGAYYMTDLSGNPQQNFAVNFLTGTGTVTTGPAVLQASPPSAQTGVPINAWVQILFNDYIDAASTGGVTLKHGSTVVPSTTTTYDGDQGVQLVPLAPLTPSTTYTINVTGVLDINGNAQSSFAAQSFTTGTAIDLVQPSWLTAACGAIQPCSGATNVPDNTTITVVFSKAMDPASFDPNTSFELYDTATATIVPATITFSAGDTTATIQPTSVLAGATTYYMEISYQASLYDLAGNALSNGTYITFTTH